MTCGTGFLIFALLIAVTLIAVIGMLAVIWLARD